MRPLALSERGITTPTVSLRSLLKGERLPIQGHTTADLAVYAQEIVTSGFPGLRHLRGRALRAQLDGYFERIVDRDFLERLWIVDPVPGWLPSRNQLARLTQAPKHHLADPALAVRLLGLDVGALLSGMTPPFIGLAVPRDGTLLGQLFESLVTLSVRVYAQAAEVRVRHLRTKDGRQEIDLILERADQRIVAIEVKLSVTVTDDDVKHLLWLQQHLGADVLDAIVITTGTHA